MRPGLKRIQACQARPGMILCFPNARDDIRIEKVNIRRDGDVVLTVGVHYPREEWRGELELIWIDELKSR